MIKKPSFTQVPSIKNHTPIWLWGIILACVVAAVIYALPNLFGESPAIQISSTNGRPVSMALSNQVEEALSKAGISYTNLSEDQFALTVRFPRVDAQMSADSVLEQLFASSDNYVIALNLLPNTPKWLSALGAQPMKLGLDLRGGMYFLLNIDMQEVINNRLQNDSTNIMNDLRQANIRYSSANVIADQGIVVSFKDANSLKAGKAYLNKNYVDLSTIVNDSALTITSNLLPAALKTLEDNATDQTLQVMRNRINELGVSEASVAKEGDGRIVIELPGVQDATRAKAVIGGTATLKAMLVNDTVDPTLIAKNNQLPAGCTLYYDENGNPYVIYNPVIITGNSISNATVGYDQQTGAPVVQVTLTGPDVSYFTQVTGQNVGHRMAIILVESTFDQEEVNGKVQNVTHTTQTVINASTIQSALPGNFQITGIGNSRAAQNLALSIRAGALPAPVQIAEERQIGPSLGEQNIKMGELSVFVAFLVVIAFIAIYYSVFGLIADVCLLLNLVFIIAVMSIIPGATLTLPGIAGVVLNVGMAIDSNVLIFERVREEIRRGNSNMLSIATGYDRAFGTILDANITTFIVALILFAVGTGVIKGFATTLMIGIVTSVFTATVVGRALVNFVYGRHPNRKLRIGI